MCAYFRDEPARGILGEPFSSPEAALPFESRLFGAEDRPVHPTVPKGSPSCWFAQLEFLNYLAGPPWPAVAKKL